MSWIIIIQDIVAGIQVLGPIVMKILEQIYQTQMMPKSTLAITEPRVVTFTIGKDDKGNIQVSVS